jgi:hypothetical protein
MAMSVIEYQDLRSDLEILAKGRHVGESTDKAASCLHARAIQRSQFDLEMLVCVSGHGRLDLCEQLVSAMRSTKILEMAFSILGTDKNRDFSAQQDAYNTRIER